MADTLDLLTVEEAKRAINKRAVADDQDDVLARHVTAVSRLIDDRCGPVVQRTVTAEVHDGGVGMIRVVRWPVVEYTLVRELVGSTVTPLNQLTFGSTLDGFVAPAWERDPTLFSGALYRRDGGLPKLWSWGPGAVELTYEAGRYEDTESVDARFKDAAGAVLRRLWQREAGAWSKGPEFWENLDGQIGVGFFRVAQPILEEMLPEDLQGRLAGIA